jgi:formylglycine-generating enzyme required for sulfatase activity
LRTRFYIFVLPNSITMKITLPLFVIIIFFFRHCPEAFTQERGVQLVQVSIDGKQVTLYDQSHALVIGMSNYLNFDKLPGVIDDVNAVKTALEAQGFNVVVEMNLTSDQMEKAFSNFIGTYGQDRENRLLFYYAGHGYSFKTSYGEELGYLVPVDAPVPTKNNMGVFQAKCFEMAQIEIQAKNIQSKHALFLFDACFSGSLFENTRAVPEYINHNTMLPVRQFITSGTANETVPDRSLFRRQFTAALDGEADEDKDGYITGTELGSFINKKVTNYSHDAQHPQYGKIRNPHLDKGDFVFVLKSTGTQQLNLIHTGKLEVTSLVPGYLTLDGNYYKYISANAFVTIPDLTEGTHTLKISGDETEEKTVVILPDQTVYITFKPNKKKTLVSDNFDLILVEGGTFQMGNDKGNRNESPIHPVTLDGFYLGQYEVTQKQWQDVMGYNPSIFTECFNCPVENVSWDNVQEFLVRLNKKTGKNYRLPTEAEWEFAASGGNARKAYEYSGSNNADDVAWYISTSNEKTHPVGLKKPNELGFYDMSGNVWEWCSDFFDNYDYLDYTQKNPKGPPKTSTKVLRGGSWDRTQYYLRNTNRGKTNPFEKGCYYGFRICLSK